MTKIKTRTKRTTSAEAAKFARLCLTNTPEGMQAAQTFIRMFRRAFREGRILTLERIKALYPSLVEINDEVDQTARREARIGLNN